MSTGVLEADERGQDATSTGESIHWPLWLSDCLILGERRAHCCSSQDPQVRLEILSIAVSESLPSSTLHAETAAITLRAELGSLPPGKAYHMVNLSLFDILSVALLHGRLSLVALNGCPQ